MIDSDLEQKGILERDERVIIVNAGPGSGKTHLFVDMMKKRIKEGMIPLAAISYTNTASDEISTRLPNLNRHENFVGTIDSFFFRYVIKPFVHLLGFCKDNMEVVPDRSEYDLDTSSIQIGNQAGNRVHINRITFSSQEDGHLVFTYKNSYGKILEVPVNHSAYILSQKKKEWIKNGRLTHTDAQYLSYILVHHQKLGQQIRSLVVSRFPTILVDEVQDTGSFQAKSILSLLSEEKCNGFVVGDSDQSIYEFNGASGHIFDSFEKLEGSILIPMTYTRRCSISISKFISKLSVSGKSIQSAGKVQGKVYVLEYDCSINSLFERIDEHLCSMSLDAKETIILSRRWSTIKSLTQQENKNKFSGSSKIAGKLAYSCEKLLEGNGEEALKVTKISVRGLFRDFNIEISSCIAAAKFDAFCRELIARIFKPTKDETWNHWTKRCCSCLKELFNEHYSIDARKIGSKFKTSMQSGEGIRDLFSSFQESDSLSRRYSIETVHSAKGKGVENVIFVSPPPTSKACPSIQWVDKGEEQRIAFVAASRAKTRLLLCLHKNSVSRLRDKGALLDDIEICQI